MDTNKKNCPYCAEEINIEAIKCKHCGEFLNKPIDSNKEPKIKRKPFGITSVFTIGIIISFFLPWFTFPFGSINGFEIPTTLDKIISTGSVFGVDLFMLKLSYLIYLIPIISIYNLLIVTIKGNNGYFLNEFIIALAGTWLIGLLLENLNGYDFTPILGAGFYLTIFISIIAIIFNVVTNIIKKIKG